MVGIRSRQCCCCKHYTWRSHNSHKPARMAPIANKMPTSAGPNCWKCCSRSCRRSKRENRQGHSRELENRNILMRRTIINFFDLNSSLIDQYFGGTFDIEMKCTEAPDEEPKRSKENFLQLSCFISQEVKYMLSGIKSVCFEISYLILVSSLISWFLSNVISRNFKSNWLRDQSHFNETLCTHEL